MDEPIFESAPDDLVSEYRDERRTLLQALGRPQPFVTDASTLAQTQQACHQRQ
jgi:hypothetical protein